MKKSKNKGQRYETVKYKDVKGIRKDLKSGTFYVEKYIRGERYSSTFNVLNEAADWKVHFHPSLNLNERSAKCKVERSTRSHLQEIESRIPKDGIKIINGNNLGLKFSEVWELYMLKHLSTLELSSRVRKVRAADFYDLLMDVQMIHLTSDVISKHLDRKKELSRANPRSRRFNFNNDLKNLKALLNWYRESYDDQFVNPVLRRHYKEGLIARIPKKKKKLKGGDLINFFKALEADDLFWRDLAETQFFLAARIQDVAGLLRSCVDMSEGIIEMENVMVWGEDKRFLYLKDCPKNGEFREVSMNPRLMEIISRRLTDSPVDPWHRCPETKKTLELVFHREGAPLSYRQIQYRYNKALKRAGLHKKFSSTHIMRHSMANMVRSLTDVDTAKVVGGWKTRELVEKIYTDDPGHVGTDARNQVEQFLYQIKPVATQENPVQNPVQNLKLV